jgi:drug/metabolite transporter (DMT)-like permease
MLNRDFEIIALGILFVLLWNSGFIGAEYGLQYTGVFSLLFWRYAFLSAILLLYLGIHGRLHWPGLNMVTHACIVGVLAHGVWLLCTLLALQEQVPAGIVALITALQPLTTGAFSKLVVGEQTSLRQWLGLIIGFSGVIIAIAARLALKDAAPTFAYLLPFCSVIAITIASLFQRRRTISKQFSRLDLDISLFYQSLATMLAFAIPAVLDERLVTEWTLPFLATMLWLIVAISLGAYGIMWRLLERMDATRVASLFYFSPPVTMIMAWLAFGDIIRVSDLFGLLVTAFGVLLVLAPDNQKSLN